MNDGFGRGKLQIPKFKQPGAPLGVDLVRHFPGTLVPKLVESNNPRPWWCLKIETGIL
jgi:hypothetical protein